MSGVDPIVKQSYALIRKDLGLEEEWSFKDSENDFDRLEDYLTHQISYLLDHDFARLANAFYRIDIPESEVTRLLSQTSKPARALAKAVIEREKLKVLTRLKYRS